MISLANVAFRSAKVRNRSHQFPRSEVVQLIGQCFPKEVTLLRGGSAANEICIGVTSERAIDDKDRTR